jgi:uncharacterized protein YegJ (DUF2314 family)
MTRSMRTLFTLLLVVCTQANSADNVSLVPDGDPQMTAAIAKARASLDQFLSLKAKAPDGVSSYFVKVLFKAGGTGEHMWVSPFRTSGTGELQGILKSEPNFAPGLRWGQEVTFSKDQITDWGYTKDGKLLGYFTTCVLLSRDADMRKKISESGRQYACAA